MLHAGTLLPIHRSNTNSKHTNDAEKKANEQAILVFQLHLLFM